MTDGEKLKKLAAALASFCIFNEIADEAAKNSKCKPFIDYMEIVYHTMHEMVEILIERSDTE